MSTRQSTAFGINVYGAPIKGLKTSNTIETGISADHQIPGNISMFEEHDARIKVGYKLDEWYELDHRDRAFEVAHYRIRRMIEMRKNEALNEAQKTRMARMKRRRR